MIFVFDADVTLIKRQGGLYEIEPASGRKTLVHPVVAKALGTFDRIEEMALTPDVRYLALAQRQSFRGPTEVSLAILDLTTSRIIFHERFCQRSQDICTEPHVVIGANGAIGFSYANLNRGEHFLISYKRSA